MCLCRLAGANCIRIPETGADCASSFKFTFDRTGAEADAGNFGRMLGPRLAFGSHRFEYTVSL